MNKEKAPENERIEVLMPLEAATGKYANYLRIGNTPAEFILDFGMLEGYPNAHCVSRIIVSPLHIKNFVAAILENVSRYETTYGIKLPDNMAEYIERGNR